MRPFALWGTKIAPLFSPSPSREGINPAKYHHRFSRSHAKPQPDRWKQLCKGKSLSGQKLQHLEQGSSATQRFGQDVEDNHVLMRYYVMGFGLGVLGPLDRIRVC
uniref:Uncharacterized protein n=1 Tax=Oryza meridionalis TaxID=40149 RepID=A0A0E0E0P0_9ORYZ